MLLANHWKSDLFDFTAVNMDRLTPERRSWNMSRIRGRDTTPEKRVRSLLHGLGFRFSLHRKDLPGRPDIVLTRFKTIVFVHGCFWHHHSGCSNAALPKTRPDFWDAKLAGNIKRDERNVCQLKQLGWQVLIVWECEISDETKLKKRLCERLAHAK